MRTQTTREKAVSITSLQTHKDQQQKPTSLAAGDAYAGTTPFTQFSTLPVSLNTFTTRTASAPVAS